MRSRRGFLLEALLSLCSSCLGPVIILLLFQLRLNMLVLLFPDTALPQPEGILEGKRKHCGGSRARHSRESVPYCSSGRPQENAPLHLREWVGLPFE